MTGLVPIVGHPSGIVFVSERKSRELQAKRKAQWVDGVLYWYQVRRRGRSVPRSTWIERNHRERPLQGYRIAQSGEAGPLVMQGVS